MRKIIITIILLLSCLSTTISNEWVFKVKPSYITMQSSVINRHPKWFSKEHDSDTFMCNLSFFTSKTYVGPYKDTNVNSDKNSKRWPILYIGSASSAILPWNENPSFNYDYKASGYPMLLGNGKKLRIGKTYFSRRNCPRTAIGTLPNGDILIYITTASNLSKLQDRLYELGCVSALNFDGGGSTFLCKGGKEVYPNKLARRYPNVLVWKEKNI